MAKKTIHTLEEIYPESAVTAQRERYEKSAEEFRSIFGDSDQLRYFSAPGRTEGRRRPGGSFGTGRTPGPLEGRPEPVPGHGPTPPGWDHAQPGR